MAEGLDLDLLPQILSLASDRLQVITYKWLSRNFSISSNCAKRLLQEVVKKHGEELEVIYTLSGWLKSNPQTYCVKLASGLKLEDGRKEFKDTCSTQVYSVQACIPKDVAVLWSAEFVQAEELFNQPSNEENCLRDNRFCGVSNSFVKRTVNGKHVSPNPPKPVIATGAAWQSKSSSILKGQTVHVRPPQQGLTGQSSSKHESTDKSDIATSANINTVNKVPPVKEPTVAVLTSKQKDQNGKDSLGNTGSLASLWGRAAKSKPPNSATETTNDIPSVSVTAEAQIRAKEAANAASSDDEHDANLRRESNHASGRKRRVVFDFSDDDDEENVVSLASPDSPKKHVAAASTNAENLTLKETSLAQKRETLEKRQENVKGLNSDSSSKTNMSSGGNSSNGGITLKLKNQSDNSEPNANENNTDQTTNAASASPKRRKVLKTRIDERGREVTEVVWEGESAPSGKTDKHTATDNAGNRPTAANKRQAAVSSNLPSKTAGNKKPAKAGGKDAKQGNILSFFKKI